MEIRLENGDRLIFEDTLVKVVRKDYSVPHIIGYEQLAKLIEAR